MLKIKLFVSIILFAGRLAALTGSYSAGVTPTVYSTSSNTTYLIEVFLNSIAGGNVPSGTTINVVFPNDYALAGLLGVSGAMADGSPTSITLGSSSRTFTLSGAFPVDSADDFVLQYNLIGIVNPNRVLTTQVFTVEMVAPNSTVLFTDSTVTVSITAGLLTCSAVPDTTQVQTASPYTITITPSTTIPSDGQLSMQFLDYWPNDQIRSKTILNTGMYCTNLTNTAASINCSRSNLVVSVITMFNAGQSAQFQFKLMLLTNPPTE